MIRAEIKAETLEDFYAQIVAAQTEAHGEHYCAHHDAIRWCRAQGAKSYAELGVNQGATLACAVLAGYERVMGVDLSLEPFWEFAPLFEKRALVAQHDSRVPIGPYDVLLIDSRHIESHMRAELAVHAPSVRRYIIAHDTASHPELHAVLVSLPGWALVRRETRGVGYTLIERQG